MLLTGWGRWGASSDNPEEDSAFKFEICFQAQCVQLYVVEVCSQQWLYGRLGHEYTSGSILMRLIDQDHFFVLANSIPSQWSLDRLVAPSSNLMVLVSRYNFHVGTLSKKKKKHFHVGTLLEVRFFFWFWGGIQCGKKYLGNFRRVHSCLVDHCHIIRREIGIVNGRFKC